MFKDVQHSGNTNHGSTRNFKAKLAIDNKMAIVLENKIEKDDLPITTAENIAD